MSIRENIVIVMDPKLEQHFDLTAWPIDDPSAIETKVMVIRACDKPELIYNDYPFDVKFEATPTVESTRNKLLPAFEFYKSLLNRSNKRSRDLLIIVSGSDNSDSSLEQTFDYLHSLMPHLLGVMLIDLGGFVNNKAKAATKSFIDYLVTIDGYSISKNDLLQLWNWLPNSFHGFQMFGFEGHHPNGSTYLVEPPLPFIGIDYAQMRHARFFIANKTLIDNSLPAPSRNDPLNYNP